MFASRYYQGNMPPQRGGSRNVRGAVCAARFCAARCRSRNRSQYFGSRSEMGFIDGNTFVVGEKRRRASKGEGEVKNARCRAAIYTCHDQIYRTKRAESFQGGAVHSLCVLKVIPSQIPLQLATGNGNTAGLFLPSAPTALMPTCTLSFRRSVVTLPTFPSANEFVHC